MAVCHGGLLRRCPDVPDISLDQPAHENFCYRLPGWNSWLGNGELSGALMTMKGFSVVV
jgi:hypothetical protein